MEFELQPGNPTFKKPPLAVRNNGWTGTYKDVSLEVLEQNQLMETFVNFDAADDDDFDFSNPSLFPPGVTKNASIDISRAWPGLTNTTPFRGSNGDSAPYPSPSSGNSASIPTPAMSPSIASEANIAATAPTTSKKLLPPLVSPSKCQKWNRTFVDFLHLGRRTEKYTRSAGFECYRCSEVCSELRLLERHVRNIHDKTDMVFCECKPDKLMRKDNHPRHKKTCRLTRAI